MSEGGVFPTYIKELDQTILQSLDDYNLLTSCQTNSYLASICEDDMFWKARVIQRYNKLIVSHDIDMPWNYFYDKLINDAMYIVHGKKLIESIRLLKFTIISSRLMII